MYKGHLHTTHTLPKACVDLGAPYPIAYIFECCPLWGGHPISTRAASPRFAQGYVLLKSQFRPGSLQVCKNPPCGVQSLEIISETTVTCTIQSNTLAVNSSPRHPFIGDTDQCLHSDLRDIIDKSTILAVLHGIPSQWAAKHYMQTALALCLTNARSHSGMILQASPEWCRCFSDVLQVV